MYLKVKKYNNCFLILSILLHISNYGTKVLFPISSIFCDRLLSPIIDHLYAFLSTFAEQNFCRLSKKRGI